MIRLTKVDFLGMRIGVYPCILSCHLVSPTSSLTSSRFVATSSVFWVICTGYEKLLSQVLEQLTTGSHSAVTSFYKYIPERSISYVISLD